jgi:hypothetical protein
MNECRTGQLGVWGVSANEFNLGGNTQKGNERATNNYICERSAQSEETQSHYVYKLFSPEQPIAGFIADILGLDSQAVNSNGTIADISKCNVGWFHEPLV